MIKSADARHQRIQDFLSGMAEGRMPEIVGERHGFRKILVQAQRARNRTGKLPDLDRVGQPSAVMIAFVRHEDLRLVREPAESRGMNNPVAVALEVRARARGRLRKQTTWAAGRIGGVGRSVHACPSYAKDRDGFRSATLRINKAARIFCPCRAQGALRDQQPESS